MRHRHGGALWRSPTPHGRAPVLPKAGNAKMRFALCRQSFHLVEVGAQLDAAAVCWRRKCARLPAAFCLQNFACHKPQVTPRRITAARRKPLGNNCLRNVVLSCPVLRLLSPEHGFILRAMPRGNRTGIQKPQHTLPDELCKLRALKAESAPLGNPCATETLRLHLCQMDDRGDTPQLSTPYCFGDCGQSSTCTDIPDFRFGFPRLSIISIVRPLFLLRRTLRLYHQPADTTVHYSPVRE
jgi:hypothetical protein